MFTMNFDGNSSLRFHLNWFRSVYPQISRRYILKLFELIVFKDIQYDSFPSIEQTKKKKSIQISLSRNQ